MRIRVTPLIFHNDLLSAPTATHTVFELALIEFNYINCVYMHGIYACMPCKRSIRMSVNFGILHTCAHKRKCQRDDDMCNNLTFYYEYAECGVAWNTIIDACVAQ